MATRSEKVIAKEMSRLAAGLGQRSSQSSRTRAATTATTRAATQVGIAAHSSVVAAVAEAGSFAQVGSSAVEFVGIAVAAESAADTSPATTSEVSASRVRKKRSSSPDTLGIAAVAAGQVQNTARAVVQGQRTAARVAATNTAGEPPEVAGTLKAAKRKVRLAVEGTAIEQASCSCRDTTSVSSEKQKVLQI